MCETKQMSGADCQATRANEQNFTIWNVVTPFVSKSCNTYCLWTEATPRQKKKNLSTSSYKLIRTNKFAYYTNLHCQYISIFDTYLALFIYVLLLDIWWELARTAEIRQTKEDRVHSQP